MLTLRTNIPALVAQQSLAASLSAMGQAIQRLSSGKRINSAADDPAGLAIANRMTANIRGLQQANRNTNDGISLAQTTEGALDEINENLQRIRLLSVQAANGSYNDNDRAAIQAEINERLEEIDRIAAHTNFNGIKVLAEGTRAIDIQVGAHDGQTISIKLTAINRDTLGLDGFNVAPTDDVPATEDPLAALDAAINQVDTLRSHLGAVQNRFESVIRSNSTTVINLSAARSRIEDADIAVEISNLIAAQIRQQAAVAVLAQANQTPQLILQLLQQSLR